MIGDELQRQLDDGCSLIVGTSHDLQPRASRAWGVRIVEGQPLRLRLLLDDVDPVTIASLGAGSVLSLTTCAIESLASLQFKCRSLGVEPPDDADRAEAERYRKAFTDEVVRVDGLATAVLEAWVRPIRLVCIAEVEQVFDQTPGPGAGGAVGV